MPQQDCTRGAKPHTLLLYNRVTIPTIDGKAVRVHCLAADHPPLEETTGALTVVAGAVDPGYDEP